MVNRAFDPTKYRKSLTKSVTGLAEGFNDPKYWIPTGNFALNYLISGDYNKGIPLGKVTMFAGEPGCLPSTAKIKIRIDEKEKWIEKEVTIEELGEYYSQFRDNKIDLEIDTPDGWQKIKRWFPVGRKNIFKIKTESGISTECAHSHMLKNTSKMEWVECENLKSGDYIQTRFNEEDKIVEIINLNENRECFDIEIFNENQQYWGDDVAGHNSAKSLIVSGSVVKNAQDMDVFPVIIDTEHALDEDWLKNAGVDTSPDKMMKWPIYFIDDAAKFISDFMKEYNKDYGDLDYNDRPKILFVIDSLGMLLTRTDVKQFEEGDVSKGEMGRRAKALRAFVTNLVGLVGSHPVGVVGTNHTYVSQDPFDPDDRVSGGSGFVYASSVVVALKKYKMRDKDDDSTQTKNNDVTGIRSYIKVMKSRYSKPFEQVEVKIPFEGGILPNSGLIELFEKAGLLTKQGNRLKYVTKAGDEIIEYAKDWRVSDDKLALVMSENSGRILSSEYNKENEPEEETSESENPEE